MIDEIRVYSINKMDQCISSFLKDINNTRGSKACPEMLNEIYIDYYGQKTPLAQLSSIIVENVSTLKIRAFDSSINNLIEKSILKSNLSVSCLIKGENIYIIVPRLTEERRKELIKIVRSIAQKYRVYIRNIRRESNLKAKSYLKNKLINKDQDYSIQLLIQKLTNDYIRKIDESLLKKERLLMTI